MTQFNVGDVVKMRVGYDAAGGPEFATGCIECIRLSTHPSAMGARVAEIDVGRVEPSVAYLHDLARWNA